MKLNQMYVREFHETYYGEPNYPFSSDQEFGWFNLGRPDLADVCALLEYLGYDTTNVRFGVTGIPGLSVVGDCIDLVIGFR